MIGPHLLFKDSYSIRDQVFPDGENECLSGIYVLAVNFDTSHILILNICIDQILFTQ